MSSVSETSNSAWERFYLRFPLLYRIEHWVFAASFITLGVTGLVQRYFSSALAVAIIRGLGGIENVRVIHRVAATAMMISVIYHIGIVLYRTYVKRYRLSMLPGLDDARNMAGWFLYNIGVRKDTPQEGRYTFGEKVEYWAVVWGTVIMVITGFMMWNPIATTRFLDGQWIPAAKAAHSAEALLAVLAIIIWHLYHVLVRTFNRSMFNGHLNEEQMVHEHPLELAEIKAGTNVVVTNPKKVERRQRLFWPIYGGIAALGLVGIYYFVTFEQTAIETIPPLTTGVAFLPLTPTPIPPTPTPVPPTPTPRVTPTVVAQVTPSSGSGPAWDSGISDLFQQSCSACHGTSAIGGLDVTTYAALLAGGNTGPGIVPGDVAASHVLAVQSQGNHAGQFTADQLATIQAWVEAGALETGSTAGPGSAQTPATVDTWEDTFADLLSQKCGACHGDTAMAGLNISSYESAVSGGVSGPGIVPGDSGTSQLAIVQLAGGHPGQFTDEEVQALIHWIDGGAPEVRGGAAASPSGAATTWTADIADMLAQKCSACHGDAAIGGLKITTYADAVKGGNSGPGVVPGDPDGSSLVTLQQAGGHAGQLTSDELQVLIDWITAGANE